MWLRPPSTDELKALCTARPQLTTQHVSETAVWYKNKVHYSQRSVLWSDMCMDI